MDRQIAQKNLDEAISNAKKRMIVSKGLDFFESQLAEANFLNAQERLRNLHLAKDRLDQGTYGICLYCKKDIPDNELLIYPEKIRCGECIKKKEEI